jgi:signal transduction histidine kinase
MVARQSASNSADVPDVEALRDALSGREAEVEELRSRIEELTAAGGDFLSDAAHAIRGPLTVTHSYLEILDSDLDEGLTDEQKSFIRIAYDNAVKLRQLIDDLVDLAALETGTANLELAPVQVNRVLASVHAEFQPTAMHNGLKSAIDVSRDIPDITGDQELLRDVIRRLLDNAVRFTAQGGSITLRSICDQRWVMVEVTDSGVGIPADRIGDAFRAFVQLHRQPGENRTHFGLGLPLCRRMVEALNGKIELTSTVGQGTTATVKLPIGE